MMSLLVLCEVESYVRGEMKQPDKEQDPVRFDNWKKNNSYAKHLITQNVGDKAIIHIQYGTTSHIAWKSLEAKIGLTQIQPHVTMCDYHVHHAQINLIKSLLSLKC